MDYQQRRLQRVIWTHTGFAILGIAIGAGISYPLGLGDTARSITVAVCAVLGVVGAVAYLARTAD
ncbi:hypothetical protein AB0B50_39260 [Streptomyces sp. NPDC041068]|uniref:hypothetical protein n=1 Tax=Streptomyces sp. NPDC041068 TaxID=3155130 RepID=UPI0033F1B92D